MREPPDPSATRDAPDAGPRPEHAAGRAASGATAGDRAADERADAARRAAGQLTKRDALLLLDSLEPDLRPMPIKGRSGRAERTPTKDW
ncbi:MAG: hypothetical protein AB7T06_39960 [Kofleriaceae bacterium]